LSVAAGVGNGLCVGLGLGLGVGVGGVWLWGEGRGEIGKHGRGQVAAFYISYEVRVVTLAAWMYMLYTLGHAFWKSEHMLDVHSVSMSEIFGYAPPTPRVSAGCRQLSAHMPCRRT